MKDRTSTANNVQRAAPSKQITEKAPRPPLRNTIWALTTYYNPVRYRRRLSNYRAFRHALGVPLLTVELGYGNAFELGSADADILVQISGGAVLWQKERLLNVALDKLPRGVGVVAWLDCDIIFQREDWVSAALATLERFPVVQLFNVVHNGAPLVWLGLPIFRW